MAAVTSGYLTTTTTAGDDLLDYLTKSFQVVAGWERTSYSPDANESEILVYIDITNIDSMNRAKYTGDLGISVDVVHNQITSTLVDENKMYLGYGQSARVAAGYFNISHKNNPEPIFSFTLRIDVGGSSGDNYDQILSKGYVLEKIPIPIEILGCNTFSDESNPVLSLNNPTGDLLSGVSFKITDIYGDDITLYRSLGIITDKSLTVTLTEDERVLLRKSFTNGYRQEILVNILTAINIPNEGIKTYDSSFKTTVDLINYMPTLSPTVVDSYSTTLNLTGNKNKFVRYFSIGSFDTGAVARKEATIEFQRIQNGSQVLDDYTLNRGVIPNIESNTFYFSVTDSRGNTTNGFKVVDLIPYVKLTSVLTLQPMSLAGDLPLIITGKYFNDDFGAEYNYLTFKYHLYKDGDIVGTFGMDPTISYGDNEYTANFTITGLDPNSVYTVEVEATDALMQVMSNEESMTAAPIFDWGKTDFNHNTKVTINGSLTLGKSNYLYMKDSSGTDIEIARLNSANELVLGYGNYAADRNSVLDGKNVFLSANYNINLDAEGEVNIKGRPYGQNKVLWEGAYHMNGGQVINLSEGISEQPHGIVLVFSGYNNSTATVVEGAYNSFFISKYEVAAGMAASGEDAYNHSFLMVNNAGFSTIGAKYLSFRDTTIAGYNNTNTATGSNNGVTYTNNYFVLRRVIGV